MNGLFDSLSSSISSATTKIKQFLAPVREFFGMQDDPIGHREDANASYVAPTKTKTTTTSRRAAPTRVAAKGALPIVQSLEMIPLLAKDATGALNTVKDGLAPLENAFASFGMTLRESFLSAMQSEEKFFKSFAKGAEQAIKALMAQIAAMAVLTFLLGGTNLGAAMGAGKVGGLPGLQNLFSPFSDGGIVSGPTLGLVGEYSGARTNPEVIAPLDKLKNLIGDSGGGAVEVFGTISGSDILLASDRATANRKRTRGY